MGSREVGGDDADRVRALLEEASQMSSVAVKHMLHAAIEKLRQEKQLSPVEDAVLLLRILEIAAGHLQRERINLIDEIFRGEL